MNLVYLIGNGFDLKLGLKTRYTDFYKWYTHLPPSENVDVQKFRDSINPEHELWSDLEIALGKYLANVNSCEVAIHIFNDVNNNLSKYLSEQNSLPLNQKMKSEAFMRHFFFPYLTFRRKSRDTIFNLMAFNEYIDTKLIVFNYTETVEKLIGWDNMSIEFDNSKVHPRILSGIEHIHGYCDGKGRLAIGVDNPEQILNNDLRKKHRVLNRFVKPIYNDTFELEHHTTCKEWIADADGIVIFGLSLGKTDQTWWNSIGKRMKFSTCALFVHFKKTELSDANAGPDYQDAVIEDKKRITKIMGLENNPDVLERIFITYSDDMFALDDVDVK